MRRARSLRRKRSPASAASIRPWPGPRPPPSVSTPPCVAEARERQAADAQPGDRRRHARVVALPGDAGTEWRRQPLAEGREGVARRRRCATWRSHIFDVLAYVRFTLEPLARAQRVRHAVSDGLPSYEREMRSFLEYVLGNYERNGIDELSYSKMPDLLRIRYGGMNDAKRQLGSVDAIRQAFRDIQQRLFS